MPILAVDSQGQLYESDPDRFDGKGYKGHVPQSSGGDLTMGAAYAKESLLREQAEKMSAITQKQMDARDRRYALGAAQAAADKVRRDSAYNSMMQTQEMQDYLTRQGVAQGARMSEVPTELSGDGTTANGVFGYEKVPVFPVSKSELRSYNLKNKVMGALAVHHSTPGLRKGMGALPMRPQYIPIINLNQHFNTLIPRK